MCTLHHEVVFPAPPSWIFAALVDAKRVAALTEQPATGEPVEGAAFSRFGDRVAGRHIELIPERRVVQAWRESAWPDGHYSIARIELRGELTSSLVGGVELLYGEGTRLVLDHAAFPESSKDDLERLWRGYWDKILGVFC